MTNKIIRMTPIGISKFVYISEPDTQFDSKGIYHCSVAFEKKEGGGGADIKLSKIAKRILPYQFECKYQERLPTLHRWFNQSRKHGRLEPILICKMNDKKPLLVMDLDHFFDIIKE